MPALKIKMIKMNLDQCLKMENIITVIINVFVRKILLRYKLSTGDIRLGKSIRK